MKIHYISQHSVLEYDEALLLTEIGHEVFCNGAYLYPEGNPLLPRPGIPGAKFYPEFVELATRYPKTELPAGLIEPFDIIIIMDGAEGLPTLELNWDKMKHKKVIYRMIGQSLSGKEKTIRRYKEQGLQVVRYSPAEGKLKAYGGGSTLIRFYKDPEEFKDWTGHDSKVVNLSQTLKGRRDFCGHDFLMGVGAGFPFKVYGDGNGDLGEFNGGSIPYEFMKGILRDSRVFLYGGTWPASYTLGFIEAWMTGIPVIAIGKDLWGHKDHSDTKDLYEVQDLIAQGDTGFFCNTVEDAKKIVTKLLEDHGYAKKIGEAGRREAIRVFGKDSIKKQWTEFLGKI